MMADEGLPERIARARAARENAEGASGQVVACSPAKRARLAEPAADSGVDNQAGAAAAAGGPSGGCRAGAAAAARKPSAGCQAGAATAAAATPQGHAAGAGFRAREPAAGENNSGMADPEAAQLEAARALIEKYKVPGGPQYLAPVLVGFDVANRDGIPLNGDRCDELLGRIAVMGWDMEEANFGNVCVQERPGRTELLEYNRRACAAHEYLADVVSDSLLYGTLTHSHLHQCLKNIAGGAEAVKPENFMVGGKLNMQAVESAQPSLAQAVRQGLQWTVLSWRIRDEQGAMELIQGAHNRKAAVAMKESALQAVARLSATCTALAGRDGTVDFQAVKKRMQQSMPEVANSSDFTGLVRFVVNLGAQRGPFIANLKEFVGQRGRNRQVKPAVFALAGQLPATLPHLVVGLVVMAFTAPDAYFTDGFSRFLTANDVKMLLDKETGEATANAELGEVILRWFHRACERIPTSWNGPAGLGAGSGGASRACDGQGSTPRSSILDFLSSLDACVCRFLTNKHLGVRHDSCHSLFDVGDLFLEELKKMAPRARLPPKEWPDGEGAGKLKGPAKASTKEPDLAPKVLLFEDGIAVTQQDVLTTAVTEEQIEWGKTVVLASDDVSRVVALRWLEFVQKRLTEICMPLVGVKRTSLNDVVVYAKQDLRAGEAVFPPAVSGLGCIVPVKGTEPKTAVKIEVNGSEFMIMPCARFPPRGVRVADWDKQAFLPPFWLIHRSPIPDRANCIWDSVSVNEMVNYDATGELLDLETETSQEHRLSSTIPVITNRKDLRAGEEFVLEVEPPPKREAVSKTFRWDGLRKNR